MSAVTGLMCFVTLLYIVGLGTIYWYAYDVEFYNVPVYALDNVTVQMCNFTYEVNEGLFQMEYKAERKCVGSRKEVDDVTKLSSYEDICEARRDTNYSHWCKKQNATISMVVLALCCSILAVLASASKGAKPAVVACTCFFAFLLGMIAMSVYSSSTLGFWITDSDDVTRSIYKVDTLYANLGDRTDFDGHKDTASFLATGELKYKSTDRGFHFSFAFIIIGWILSLFASVMAGIRDHVNVSVVPAPVEQVVAAEGGQAVATELR